MKYSPKEIRSIEEYRLLFKAIGAAKRKEALAHAVRTREFEVNLYWTRATYFWAFIVLAYGGFFGLATSEESKVPEKNELQFIVASIGFVFSFGWYLANRGSKYWQENWEKQVELLEDKIIGPLQKTTLHESSFPFSNFLGPFKLSVTKINQVLSLYVTAMWLFLSLRCLSTIFEIGPPVQHFGMWLVTFLTLTGVAALFLSTRQNWSKFHLQHLDIANDLTEEPSKKQ